MELMRSSQYLDIVPNGATVLADRGFKEVKAVLVRRGCRLLRPASVRKDEKMIRENVLNVKTIAGLCVHIERVIRRVRVYRFVQMHARSYDSLWPCKPAGHDYQVKLGASELSVRLNICVPPNSISKLPCARQIVCSSFSCLLECIE